MLIFIFQVYETLRQNIFFYIYTQDPAAYEDWRHWKFPNLVEVLDEFPSVKPFAPLLLLHLTPLQPRFYSISSSADVHQGQIHLTVAVVQYTPQGLSFYTRPLELSAVKHFPFKRNYLTTKIRWCWTNTLWCMLELFT